MVLKRDGIDDVALASRCDAGVLTLSCCDERAGPRLWAAGSPTVAIFCDRTGRCDSRGAGGELRALLGRPLSGMAVMINSRCGGGWWAMGREDGRRNDVEGW